MADSFGSGGNWELRTGGSDEGECCQVREEQRRRRQGETDKLLIQSGIMGK